MGLRMSGMDKIVKKKTWTAGRLTALGLGIVFVSLVLYKLLWGDFSTKLNVESARISTAKVIRDDFQEFIPITGNVLPIETVFLDAVEGGVVERIYAEEGQNVEAGDTLLRLGNTGLLLSILQQETQLFEQVNNLRNTKLAMEEKRISLEEQLLEIDYQLQEQRDLFDRNQQLADHKVIAEEEFERIRYRLDYLTRRKHLAVQSYRQDSIFRTQQIRQLEGSLSRMEATMEVVQQRLEDLVVRAPIAGQLTSLTMEIGELKTQGQRLGQIDKLDRYKVRASIDEHYIRRVFPGQEGEFELSGDSFRLVVHKVYPEVLNGSFEVDLMFSDLVPEDIRRGQTFHIKLALGRLVEALLIPRGGFFQQTGGKWIFVLQAGGEVAVKRPIRLGRQNTQHYEVLEGLEPGETVIVSSYENYGDIDKLVLKQQ